MNYEVMKNFYCSRCNIPSKKLFNCKYEKNDIDYFFLCAKCAFECSKIFKKTFNNKILLNFQKNCQIILYKDY